MTDLDALVSITQTLLRNRNDHNEINYTKILHTTWDVVEKLDVNDCFRNVTNRAISELCRRYNIIETVYDR